MRTLRTRKIGQCPGQKRHAVEYDDMVATTSRTPMVHYGTVRALRREGCARTRKRSDLLAPHGIRFRKDGIWRVVRVEGSDMASRSLAYVQVRVTNPLAPFTNVANARLAEKIVERIAHHATIDPAGWEAFAAAEIKLALDAAARSPQ
jgi:hypothetical protein